MGVPSARHMSWSDGATVTGAVGPAVTWGGAAAAGGAPLRPSGAGLPRQALVLPEGAAVRLLRTWFPGPGRPPSPVSAARRTFPTQRAGEDPDMSATSSRSTVVHRGPRHELDPDRRVKWTLRRKRRGQEETVQRVLVRRRRRSDQLPAPVLSRRARRARRAERHEAAQQLREQARLANAELHERV